MERQFDNTNQLPAIIAASRIKKDDPVAEVRCYKVERRDPITFEIIGYTYYVSIDSEILTDEQISTALAAPQTTAETNALNDFLVAWTAYESQPGWFDNNYDQMVALITPHFFGGKTAAAVKTDIDNSSNYKAAMKALIDYEFDFFNFFHLRSMKNDLLVRDLVARLRR